MEKNKREENNSFKIVVIVLAVIAASAAAITAIFFMKTPEVVERNGNITSFSFSNGAGLGGFAQYSVTRKGDKAAFMYECLGCGDNDKKVEREIDVKVFDDLAVIVRENGLGKWDGFNKSADGIMDGYGFTLKIEFDDEKKIDAHGYMQFPDNFNDVRDKFEDCLDKYIEE